MDSHYVVIPQDKVGCTWTPELEATAGGIATAIYGPDDVIVMGRSAIRLREMHTLADTQRVLLAVPASMIRESTRSC